MPQPKSKTQSVDAQIQLNNLANQIDVIKNNHLAHMADDIDELKEAVKENRSFFEAKFDKLDNRIWWIVGLTVTTLFAIVVEKMI